MNKLLRDTRVGTYRRLHGTKVSSAVALRHLPHSLRHLLQDTSQGVAAPHMAFHLAGNPCRALSHLRRTGSHCAFARLEAHLRRHVHLLHLSHCRRRTGDHREAWRQHRVDDRVYPHRQLRHLCHHPSFLPNGGKECRHQFSLCLSHGTQAGAHRAHRTTVPGPAHTPLLAACGQMDS